MPRITLLILLVLFGMTLHAQENNAGPRALSDTIQVRKRGGGYPFYLGEKKLTNNGLKRTLSPNVQASGELRSARFSATMASVLGYAGGFMVGWPLGTALAGGKPVWALAGAGAGLIAVSIPFGISANKKARKAVGTYNAGLLQGAFRNKGELYLTAMGNGVGLALSF